MSIKLWSFTFNGIAGRARPDHEDARAVQQAFDFNLRQLADLERIGFEGVFFSEHHFLNSLSPNPNLLVAALAQRTKTLKLGVLGSVLAFHQPWRLAEDIGMLDYLTQGRLEIGFVSGIATEYPFAGIETADAKAMFPEALDFLDRALEASPVTHHGKYWNFDAIPIQPRPRAETRRRKWLSAYSEGTARLAARRGYRIATAFQSVVAANRTFDFYREEAGRVGFAVTPDDIALRRQVLIWDDDAGAAELHAQVQAAGRERINDIIAQIDERKRAAGDTSPRLNLLEGLLEPADEYLHGSPRTIADIIVDQCRRTGAGQFIAYHPPALEESEIERHYRLWAEVVPILAKADVRAPLR